MKKALIFFSIIFSCISGAVEAQVHASATQQVKLALSNVIVINVGQQNIYTGTVTPINPNTGTVITGNTTNPITGTATPVAAGKSTEAGALNPTANPVEEVYVKSNGAFNITIATTDAKYAIKTNGDTKNGIINVEITDAAKGNNQSSKTKSSLVITSNSINPSTDNSVKPLYITYKMERETASAANVVYTATQA